MPNAIILGPETAGRLPFAIVSRLSGYEPMSLWGELNAEAAAAKAKVKAKAALKKSPVAQARAVQKQATKMAASSAVMLPLAASKSYAFGLEGLGMTNVIDGQLYTFPETMQNLEAQPPATTPAAAPPLTPAQIAAQNQAYISQYRSLIEAGQSNPGPDYGALSNFHDKFYASLTPPAVTRGQGSPAGANDGLLRFLGERRMSGMGGLGLDVSNIQSLYGSASPYLSQLTASGAGALIPSWMKFSVPLPSSIKQDASVLGKMGSAVAKKYAANQEAASQSSILPNTSGPSGYAAGSGGAGGSSSLDLPLLLGGAGVLAVVGWLALRKRK